MTHEKCPPRLAAGSAGGESAPLDRTVTTTPIQLAPWTATSLDDLAVDFTGGALDVERKLVGAGWFDPAELNDAGYEAGLSGADFLTVQHSFQFAFLCEAAHQGVSVSINDCVTVAAWHNVYVQRDDVAEMIRSVGPDDDLDLPMLARTVVALSRRRKEAREHLRSAARLLAGNDVEVIVRPKPKLCPVRPADRSLVTSRRRKRCFV
jgi:hypothetical protein